MIAICIARFDLSLLDSKRCTPVDFELYSKAHRIKDEEKTRMIALQAWMNQSVQGTKKVGKEYKSLFEEFNDFYDSEKQFNLIFDPNYEVDKPKLLTLADKNRLLNQRREGGK